MKCCVRALLLIIWPITCKNDRLNSFWQLYISWYIYIQLQINRISFLKSYTMLLRVMCFCAVHSSYGWQSCMDSFSFASHVSFCNRKVHISLTKWYIYLFNAFWDLRDGSTGLGLQEMRKDASVHCERKLRSEFLLYRKDQSHHMD